MVPAKELAQAHYAEHEGKPFYPKLVDFLSSGAVVAMVWEGECLKHISVPKILATTSGIRD